MFENIVTEKNINFNDLEKKIYKFVCELGCSLLRDILEQHDKELEKNRDKEKFRHRGLKTSSIKTTMGIVNYKRAIYEYKEKGESKFTFLLDDTLDLTEFGKISASLVEKILTVVVETNSYRDAAKVIMETCNISISHETVRDITIKAGIKIIEKENEEVKLGKKEKLVAGKKETVALFEEADGLWINLQGKDRKEQIEAYKARCEKEGKEYKEQSSVKSELKLYVSYEGWKKDDSRHPLVNKMYITGFMSTKEMIQKRNAKIFQTYDISKIELRVLNGDGASWISKLATKDTIQQKDNFHIHQEIIRDIQEDEYRRQLERLIAERRYDEVPVYLEYLKYELGGEEKAIEKIEKLASYLAEGLPRYQDILMEQNRELPEAPTGIEYKDPGIMESQIFTVLTKRFKSRKIELFKIWCNMFSKDMC